MAFIIKSSKYSYNFLSFARQASLLSRKKKFLLEADSSFRKINELWVRTNAAAVPYPVQSSVINKNITNLHANLKTSLVELHNVETTINCFRKNKDVLTSSQLLLMLKCCGAVAYKDSEESRIKTTMDVWKTAKELGTEIDIAHYNSLLSTYIENNYKFSPNKILSEILDAGLEPNCVTYRLLLKVSCQQGNIKEAGIFLEKMKEKNFSINEYDFCSLIQGHCESGDLEEGLKILNIMKERGIQPSLDPYVYLLCGYAKYGDMESIEKLLNELSEMNMRMTDSFLLNVVYTLIVNDYTDHAYALMAKIKKSNDYEKTLVKVVHKLLHKKKDEDALKIFGYLSQAGYLPEYLENQALSIVEHFIFNRKPTEVMDICRKIEEKGWTSVAYSHGLKKAILRRNFDYCKSLLQQWKENGFPIRIHYFWPLIVRNSEKGNQEILAILKYMKSLGIVPCFNTALTYVQNHYRFSDDWKSDIDVLKKHGIKECFASLMALRSTLLNGNINDAELIASSYGIFRPHNNLLDTLIISFAKWCPQEETKLLNIIYCLAHDCSVYHSYPNYDVNEKEEDNDGALVGLNGFYDKAIRTLMLKCPQDVFLSLLQNASKKKVLMPPQTASKIREHFNNEAVDDLLKEFSTSDNFELDEELLKKKLENASGLLKINDPNGIIAAANKNDLIAEKLLNERGSEASLDELLSVISMLAKLRMFDKAFELIDRLKNYKGTDTMGQNILNRFRVILHHLRVSGNIEKVIDAYNTGVSKGFLNEDHVIPVIRTILLSDNVEKEIIDHYPFFEKIKHIGGFFEVLKNLISRGHTDLIGKLTESFSVATNENIALTALFTAYLANGCTVEAKKILESRSFKFKTSVFIYWFGGSCINSEVSFDEAMKVVMNLRPEDRTFVYAYILSRYQRERDYEKIKLLCLQCQEDSSTDPFFLEHLRQCLKKGDDSYNSNFSKTDPEVNWNNENNFNKYQDILSANKCSDSLLKKILSGKLPPNVVHKTIPLLASEGKINELILLITKYHFGRFSPEIAEELLKRNKLQEFLEFLTILGSLKKHGEIFNCFVSQEERIIDLIRMNDEFFQKILDLSQRTYETGKYEALIVFIIKVCVQIPEKLSKAEELLKSSSSRILSHFRNYCLSNILLNSSAEIDFCKNVLENEKVKSVFSEALDHFYDRIITYHNENGDVRTALLYLEKAEKDGLSENLNKEQLGLLKKNLENQGISFPYPHLLQEKVAV